jgi:hypothetical protein
MRGKDIFYFPDHCHECPLQVLLFLSVCLAQNDMVAPSRLLMGIRAVVSNVSEGR